MRDLVVHVRPHRLVRLGVVAVSRALRTVLGWAWTVLYIVALAPVVLLLLAVSPLLWAVGKLCDWWDEPGGDSGRP